MFSDRVEGQKVDSLFRMATLDNWQSKRKEGLFAAVHVSHRVLCCTNRKFHRDPLCEVSVNVCRRHTWESVYSFAFSEGTNGHIDSTGKSIERPTPKYKTHSYSHSRGGPSVGPTAPSEVVSPLSPLQSLLRFWPLLMQAGLHICFFPAMSRGKLGQITALCYSWGCRKRWLVTSTGRHRK